MNAYRFAGIAAVLFGVITLFEGGRMVFGGPEVWAAAGNVVPWVLYFNFTAGFVYVVTGLLTLFQHPNSKKLALVLAVANAVVLVSLGVYAAMGGLFELRTMAAMGVRTVFWSVQAVVLSHVFKQSSGAPR